MCLAVPGLVEQIDEEASLRVAVVSFGGIRRQICLELVPEARVGDYVLVPVGFALSVIDAERAREIFELLAELEPTSLDEIADVAVPMEKVG